MDDLIVRVRKNLLENPAVEIKESAIWYLPVVVYDVVFKRLKRSKMDILMKMLLLAFEETTIKRAANLAEMLLVEELFIADLIAKMQRTGLIHLENSSYKLTAKGQKQLMTGFMEEEMDEEETVLCYSTSHDQFWPEQNALLPGTDEELTCFRYLNQQDKMTVERIFQVLSVRDIGLEETEFQTVVSDVVSFNQQMIKHVPCLEFQMYNKNQDIFYARVWNTWLGQWDDTLEKLIEEQEQVKWRTRWTEVSEFSD